jgi:hypothetical protein
LIEQLKMGVKRRWTKRRMTMKKKGRKIQTREELTQA